MNCNGVCVGVWIGEFLMSINNFLSSFKLYFMSHNY